jgi:hypothetical protein
MGWASKLAPTEARDSYGVRARLKVDRDSRLKWSFATIIITPNFHSVLEDDDVRVVHIDIGAVELDAVHARRCDVHGVVDIGLAILIDGQIGREKALHTAPDADALCRRGLTQGNVGHQKNADEEQ